MLVCMKLALLLMFSEHLLLINDICTAVRTHRSYVGSGVHVNFTNETVLIVAIYIIPIARLIPEGQTGLSLSTITRFSSSPVGVFHHSHCITVGVHSPDELRLAVWVNSLTSRPVTVVRGASSQRCL